MTVLVSNMQRESESVDGTKVIRPYSGLVNVGSLIGCCNVMLGLGSLCSVLVSK